MIDEVQLYSDSSISITTARVVVGSKVYAMRNITSVGIGSTPPSRNGAIVLLIIGAVAMAGSVGVFRDDKSAGIQVLLFGIVATVVGILWFKSRKPTYHLVIGSASGEAHNLHSKDLAYIRTVVSKINDAIVQCK